MNKPLQKEVSDLLDIVRLGQEAASFKNSQLGKYLVAKALKQRKQAMELMLTTDPNDVTKMRAVQNEAVIADLFLVWIDESLVQAQEANEMLDDIENYLMDNNN